MNKERRVGPYPSVLDYAHWTEPVVCMRCKPRVGESEREGGRKERDREEREKRKKEQKGRMHLHVHAFKS